MQQTRETTCHDNGPWSDGWYVVASAKTQMPQRCMVCGEDVDALDTTPVPLPGRGRGVVSGTLFLLAGERFVVSHGRCHRHRRPWSKYAGVLTGIASIGTMIAFAGSMLVTNGRFGLVQAVLVGAFVFSIVSTIWLALLNLRIEKTDGEHVWIGGFGRGYRATLGPLQKTR